MRITSIYDIIILNVMEDSMSNTTFDGLHQVIPDLHIFNHGGNCPYQAEGTVQGWSFYFRSRGSKTSLSLARTIDDAVAKPLYESILHYVDVWNDAGFSIAMPLLLSSIRKADFLYEFPFQRNVDVITEEQDHRCEWWILPDDQQDSVQSYGSSPEDAYRRLYEPSDEIMAVMPAYDQVIAMLYEKDPSDIPLNTDDRVFPSSRPAFIIKQ